MPVKGRFAPSPSGRMHLGNLFSFLLAWLSVRHEGGTIVLRIEDLDPVRCLPSHAWQLMEDLEWLGLTWDEGGDTASCWQSNRGRLYAAAFEALTERGLTYPCFCSRAQLHAASGSMRLPTSMRCLPPAPAPGCPQRRSPGGVWKGPPVTVFGSRAGPSPLWTVFRAPTPRIWPPNAATFPSSAPTEPGPINWP